MKEEANRLLGIGQIQKETNHIPSKQEELDWRKEQLKKFFGKQYDKLFKEAKDFFRTKMKFMIKNRYTRGDVTFYPTSKENENNKKKPV